MVSLLNRWILLRAISTRLIGMFVCLLLLSLRVKIEVVMPRICVCIMQMVHKILNT
ncbi:MAG TPA: hypothetical protein [Caudoviricetes sp.]|nr:MAG TPA: hypothetical protein [Caudoviricetes sp.]